MTRQVERKFEGDWPIYCQRLCQLQSGDKSLTMCSTKWEKL